LLRKVRKNEVRVRKVRLRIKMSLKRIGLAKAKKERREKRSNWMNLRNRKKWKKKDNRKNKKYQKFKISNK